VPTLDEESAAIARAILDANHYMVLGTADADGHPWVSPVWFAHDDYRELFWVSRPGSRHSTNIAARTEVSIAVFDSTVPVGQGQAVYMSGVAALVPDSDLRRGMETFSAKSVVDGAGEWTEDRVRPPAEFRLYRAVVSEHWILDPTPGAGDFRVPVTPQQH
jgi:Pyridoxamine 5'-phosphate oxidase